MTLKEKLKQQIEVPLHLKELQKLEQIADEYVIGFADWMAKEYWLNSSGKYLKSTRTSELLEIYKKQKEL